MSYNYENDPRILAAAQYLGPLNERDKYSSIVEKWREVNLPFYDFHAFCIKNPGFSLEIPADTSPVQDILDFTDHIISFFCRYHSHMFNYTPHEIELAAGQLIIGLFNEFSSKLLGLYDNNFDTIINYAQTWTGVTSDIIRLIYHKIPSAINTFIKPEYTFPLYTGLMDIVDECYESFVRNLKFGPFTPASKVILYNFWGDEYFLKTSPIRLDVINNTEEQEMTDIYFNKLRFTREVRNILKNCMDSVSTNSISPTADYSFDLTSLVQNLFSEYTKHLRRKQIIVNKTILFAIDFWRTTTSHIIIRETQNQMERSRSSLYAPEEHVHFAAFRTTVPSKQKIELLMDIRSTILDRINFIYSDYEQKLKNGELVYPWAGDLDALHINYNKLWEAINNKYIYGIGPDVLEDSIKCGDLSVIQSHIINPDKNSGALFTLVQEIGARVEAWYIAASTTLKDSLGKYHTKDTVQKLRKISTAAQDMLDIYQLCTPQKGKQTNKHNI